ncbi:cupin 2 domain-containing protein [Ophiostoma piceae UAMH 11346]|uniref:Cupin 2 domain-containing protein n=1 Tax=Ophiostoma piceae (strain UAMH 11346) TaxID=1262450 RepID=S3CZJ6_OPHP1|nr:cupin 2 domain-containing protein [Ophiostoma piceae UAMH 11346]
MADQDWDHYLQQSSALGILRPDAVFDIYSTGDTSLEMDVPNDQITTHHNSPPPALRVVRTGHTAGGQSVFVADDYLPSSYPQSDGASFAVIDRRPVVPVAHSSTASSPHSVGPPASHCPPHGAAFVLCDIPPYQSAVPFRGSMENSTRRTLSVDYVVVVSGEVVVCLHGGDERTVQAGEVVVQQGTKHAWVNRTPQPCRLLYVMIAGKPIALPNGQILHRTYLERR